MTKFEEELNKIEVEVQTPLDKYIVEKAASDESLYAQHYEAVLEKFKDWHSDEQYQKAKRMVEHVQVENEMLKAKLKSQLQQQALPVVKDFVAEWVECVKGKDNNATALLTDLDNMPDDVNEWLFFQRNDDNINLILRAWLDGYTVEKPQLFYLKNKLTTSYLELDKTNDYFHHTMNPAPYYDMTRKSQFTQQEIDSMQTGSYEQIEVTE